MIELIQPGSEVLLWNEVEARVVAVSLEAGHHVLYRCVWWDGRIRTEEWLEEFEVCLTNGTKSKIGFLNGDKP